MRYSKFMSEINIGSRIISYNRLTPKVEEGNPDALKPNKIRPTPRQTLEILFPFGYVRIIAQIKAVVPLSIYLILFQVLVLRQPIDSAVSLAVGLIAVILGLAVFMEGLSTGLMPFGTIIGSELPRKASMPVVLIIIGVLGVGVTFAEPAIGALQAFGGSVDVNVAPYLYELLNNWTLPLVFIVGGGVGLAAAVFCTGAATASEALKIR